MNNHQSLNLHHFVDHQCPPQIDIIIVYSKLLLVYKKYVREIWDLETTDLSIHTNASTAASRQLKWDASSNNAWVKSWNNLLQDTKMDSKNNCKSGDKFPVSYHSLSIPTWGSPQSMDNGWWQGEHKSLPLCLVLILLPNHPILATVRGRILK